jgi:hypothetical protein
MRVVIALFSLALIAGCGDSTTSTQKQAIGTACTASSDCGTGDFFCATQGHPGGYCKRDCKAEADCPSGSTCAGADSGAGECHKICTTDNDCRVSEGYACNLSHEESTSGFCDPPEAG